MFGFKHRAKEREAQAVTDDSQFAEDEADVSGNAAQPTSAPLEGFSAPSQSMRESISSMIDEIRAESRAYLAEIQNGSAFAGTPTEKVSAAREFVRNSKVGMAALGVWDATIHYCSWCKREDWPKINDIGVSDIADDPQRGTRAFRLPDSTGFRWRERAWMFTLDERRGSYSGDTELGRLRVTVDGELVMELAVATGYSEIAVWHETDVNALTVGPWAGTLVEMWAELKLAAQRRWKEADTVRLEAQASRIKLG
ncbi:MAG: hypothetical protein ACREFL_09460 [Stellaceae bacterium]